MKNKYGDKIRVFFIDTDSLMYDVCTNDYYQDVWARKEEYDLASYPKSSSFYDPTNNNVVGKFKDESTGPPISEFERLKPKMDSYQNLNDA